METNNNIAMTTQTDSNVKRYFYIVLNYDTDSAIRSAYTNILFVSYDGGYVNRNMITKIAKDDLIGRGISSPNVIITSITELSENDFNDFIAE